MHAEQCAGRVFNVESVRILARGAVRQWSAHRADMQRSSAENASRSQVLRLAVLRSRYYAETGNSPLRDTVASSAATG
jgi:hypothetical protein